jgi:hypothetical protein
VEGGGEDECAGDYLYYLVPVNGISYGCDSLWGTWYAKIPIHDVLMMFS